MTTMLAAGHLAPMGTVDKIIMAVVVVAIWVFLVYVRDANRRSR